MELADLESLDDLASLSPDRLAAWLRQATLAWAKAADRRERVRAFSPAVLLAHVSDEGAGGALADELASAFGGNLAVPGEAAARALETWSLLQDGTAGAALLVQLAGELGAVQLPEGLDALINKSDSASVEASVRLSGAIATAACERLSRDAAERAGVDARRAGLMLAEDAARILAYASRGRLERIVPLAMAMRLPGAEAGERARERLIVSLAASHEIDEIGAALDAQAASAAEQSAKDWLLAGVAEFKPLKRARRAWLRPKPSTPTIQETMTAIQALLESMSPEDFEMIIKAKGEYPGKVSIFSSRQGVDPSLDSTDRNNVYDIEIARARRSR